MPQVNVPLVVSQGLHGEHVVVGFVWLHIMMANCCWVATSVARSSWVLSVMVDILSSITYEFFVGKLDGGKSFIHRLDAVIVISFKSIGGIKIDVVTLVFYEFSIKGRELLIQIRLRAGEHVPNSEEVSRGVLICR